MTKYQHLFSSSLCLSGLLWPEGTWQIKTVSSDEPCCFKCPTCAQTFWVAVDNKKKKCFCLAGATKVPERLSCLHQRGNDQHRSSALQDKGRQWQEPDRHDPQAAEGAGARGPTEGHVRKRVEEGTRGFIFTYELKCSLKEKDDVTLCSHDQNKTNNNKKLFDFLMLVPPEEVNLWQESK